MPQPRFRPIRYGRYILLEKIGQGGMAEVFRAVARGTQGFQRILVVKRILPEMSRDPRFVQMFIDEAKISALISHPNVVQVYEFGKLYDSHFLTMEFVHGRNLGAVMGKLAELGRLPPADVIAEVARQSCLGLHHAHTMQNAQGKSLAIIHRDVTPANLMVGFNGAVKVLDFGIARAAEEVKETRTQAGAVKGKVAYLAPEQINRQPVDHRSDIFALGIVLHECLTGQRLFKADNPLAAMKAILDMPIPPPSAANPDVPKKLDHVVARALQRNPELRYPSAKAMAMDLEAVLVDQRYFSQRLPNFLKEVFKDEVTDGKDRLLGDELEDLEPTPEPEPIDLAWSGVEEIESPGARPNATMPRANAALSAASTVEVPEVDAEVTGLVLGPIARLLNWLGEGRNKLWVAGGLAGTILLVVLVGALSGGAEQSAGASRPETAARPVKPARVSISVDSSPQGATIVASADGKPLGTTPARLSLPYGEERVELRLELPGHEIETLQVIPDLDKPVFGRLRTKAVAPAVTPASTPRSGRALDQPRETAPIPRARPAPSPPTAPTPPASGRPNAKRPKRGPVPLDPFAD